MTLTNVIFLVYQVIAVLAIIHVVMDNRQPAKTMAWALVIYFIPIIGILAYIFFGVNTRKERYVSRRSLSQLSRRSLLTFAEQYQLELPERHRPVIDLFTRQSESLPFGGNKVDICTSGYDFFPALLRDIAQATSHIHVDVYIFEDDPLGFLVSDALIARAKAGVEVRVIYDDVGCWSVDNRFFERMREAGIEVEPFLPVRFPKFTSKANYRNHRKLIVIDGRVGYIGGMNIALRYVKGAAIAKGKALSPWRDTMARIEGHGIYSLQRAFLIDWYFVDRTLLNDRKYYPPTTAQAMGSGLLQTVTSGPVSPYPDIMQGYVRIILSARRYVYIETPYFLPNTVVLLALKTAATTGIDVRILVPRHSDAWLTEWASRSYLREVTEAGAKVYLYEAGFLHSKLMVSDDSVCTCGSTNIDFRSFENNFEANTFFYDEDLSIRMRHIFLADEQQSTPLQSLAQRMHPKFFARLWESITRLFSPLL